MDWAPTEMMTEVGKLARTVLSTSRDPWRDLGEAGLLEVEDWLDALTLVREVGRSTLDLPVLETLVLAAPLRERARDLGLPGDAVLSAMLQEPGRPHPAQAATRLVDGRLHGHKVAVAAADRATALVVPAREGLFAVKAEAARPELSRSTDGGFVGEVRLEGLEPFADLGGPELVAPWADRVSVGIAALLLGLSERALEYTAAYVRERHQFGVPIGSFQAVRQRVADAWIDLQTMEVGLWRAAFLQARREAGDPEVRRAVLVARTLANLGAHRVVAAAQHLHGGMGYDKDHGLHRCFLRVKQWEFVLGGANGQLAALGRWQREAVG